MEKEEKPDNIENDVARMCRQCEERLRKYQSASKRSLIAGIVVILVVIGYLSWIAVMVKDLLTPEGLTIIMRQRAAQAIPAASQEIKQTLKTNAPKYADMMEKRMLEMLPVLRETAEKNIYKLTESLLATFDEKTTLTVNRFIDENQKELESAMKELKALENEEYARRLVEIIVHDHILVAVDQTLMGLVGHDLDTMMDVTASAFESIKDQLIALQTEEELTQEEKLQKEILELILKYLQQSRGTAYKQDKHILPSL